MLTSNSKKAVSETVSGKDLCQWKREVPFFFLKYMALKKQPKKSRAAAVGKKEKNV